MLCTFITVTISTGSPQRYLAAALRHMPRVHRLTLGSRARLRLLDAITPATAPNLRVLHVVLKECAHHYIHRPEVSARAQATSGREPLIDIDNVREDEDP